MKELAKKMIVGSWVNTINLINLVSPTYANKILHYKHTKKFIDLKNPTKFNEKLQWLKINYNDPLISLCADKYSVYEYVKDNGDPNILNKLLGAYDSVDEIDWDKLPEKFAIKCTHGSKYNIVTDNKSELNKGYVFETLTEWMKEKYGRGLLEYHYDKIKPRIIVEEYIENSDGFYPIDYKIYCFNGVAKLVLVCTERVEKEEDLKLDFFDLEWNRLNISNEKYTSNKEIKRPTCLDDMIKHANQLAKPFPFVRIDFYDKDGIAMLGELTFTPYANMFDDYTEYGQKYLGSLLELPAKNIS